MPEAGRTRFFAVKVTVGQERNVVRIMEARIGPGDRDIRSILFLPSIKGYIFVEAESKERVSLLTQGIRHVKARPVMPVEMKELMPHLVERPMIETISMGDVVEIISGPLQGISG